MGAVKEKDLRDQRGHSLLSDFFLGPFGPFGPFRLSVHPNINPLPAVILGPVIDAAGIVQVFAPNYDAPVGARNDADITAGQLAGDGRAADDVALGPADHGGPPSDHGLRWIRAPEPKKPAENRKRPHQRAKEFETCFHRLRNQKSCDAVFGVSRAPRFLDVGQWPGSRIELVTGTRETR
jgi:hypothetical protein